MSRTSSRRPPTPGVEVVCHGAGIGLVEKARTDHAEAVEALIKRGVRFVACENTMRQKSIRKEDLLAGRRHGALGGPRGRPQAAGGRLRLLQALSRRTRRPGTRRGIGDERPDDHAQELEGLRRPGRAVELIDVRTPAEYREVHAEAGAAGPARRARPEGRHGGPRRRGGRAAVHDLPVGRPGPAGGRAVPRRRVHNVVNVEGGHAGLGAGRAAGRPRGRRRSRSSGRCGSPPATLVVLGTVLGAFVHRGSSACRRSSGRGWSSPG